MAKFCSNCGAELDENADVCVKCGKLVNNNVGIRFDMPAGRKSKLAAILLAFFLGPLGIHNFYLGYTSKGIVQLLLSTVGIILLFMGPIVATGWAFVEFILLLTGGISKDANGNELV